jgi:2-hydroxy-6-oxonona-2,4-dienedioate hydrolase
MAAELTHEGTSKVLETPEGNLHYHEAGEGPPLLLLHGSGPGVSGWANFRGNLGIFSQSFRTLILDLPGFGGTPDVEGHPMMTAPAAVIRFLDGLGIDTTNILGNSMGGGVGARVAADHPDRVIRLACIGGIGMPIFNSFPSEGIKLLVDFVEDPTRERIIAWMESMVYDRALITEAFVDERWAQATDKEANASIVKMYSRANLDAMRDGMSSPAFASSLEFLARIQAPTLITWGRDDRVSPLDMALVPMRLVKHAELHTFPNCGHWAMLERKDEFESVMISFFSRA